MDKAKPPAPRESKRSRAERHERSPYPRGAHVVVVPRVGLLAHGSSRLLPSARSPTFPDTSSSGSSEIASQLQWRDRVGISPDFPVMPRGAPEDFQSSAFSAQTRRLSSAAQLSDVPLVVTATSYRPDSRLPCTRRDI